MADEFRIPTEEELAAMRDVDVRTVDKSTLVDIKAARIWKARRKKNQYEVEL